MPSRECHRRAACAKVDRRGRWCVGVGVGASTVTQLSVCISTPTLRITVVENRAGVILTCRNGNCCAARSEVDG